MSTKLIIVHLFKIHYIMHENTLKQGLFLLFMVSLTTVKSFAQADKVTLNTDQKFELLLNEKRKINPSLLMNDCYKIQIYNGDSESSKREINRFKTEFNYLDATVIFNTPYYKVWVGNFKSKIDAQRHLIEIQKKYANSLIIKPSK